MVQTYNTGNSSNNTYRMTSIDSPKPMSDRMFLRFSSFIRNELGINMTEAKRVMLQARLQKRLRKLSIPSFEEYYDYVFSHEGIEKELPHMIDVVTTNKTDFFREPKHFDYLTHKVLPEYMKKLPKPTEDTEEFFKKKIMVWSAGCSSGEEVYTLAMVLSEFAEKNPGFHFSVLGTDISTKVLQEAVLGIYPHERVEPIPLSLRKKYLLKSKDKTKELVRISPELRAVVNFQRINLMSYDLGLHDKMDIIFCRNVLIYFNRQTQEGVLNRICRYMKPDGYIFMGHSETLTGLNVPLTPVTSTVYRKR